MDEKSLLKRQTAVQLSYGFLPAVCSLVLKKKSIFLCFWAHMLSLLCTGAEAHTKPSQQMETGTRTAEVPVRSQF